MAGMGMPGRANPGITMVGMPGKSGSAGILNDGIAGMGMPGNANPGMTIVGMPGKSGSAGMVNDGIAGMGMPGRANPGITNTGNAQLLATPNLAAMNLAD